MMEIINKHTKIGAVTLPLSLEVYRVVIRKVNKQSDWMGCSNCFEMRVNSG